MDRPRVLIKGAGDLASAVAHRLFAAGFFVAMTEIPTPLSVRRGVSFSEAVYDREKTVEGIMARLVSGADQIEKGWRDGVIAVLVDPQLAILDDVAFDGLVERRGGLYMARKGIAVLFEDKRHDVLSGFWREVLGLEGPQPGYRVITDRFAFHYHLGPDSVSVSQRLSFQAAGHRYDQQGRPSGRLYGAYLMTALSRREYLFVRRVWWPWPWIV